MFTQLREKIGTILQGASHQVSARDFQGVYADLEATLIDADVAWDVVNSILDKVRKTVEGTEFTAKVKPRDVIYSALHDAVKSAFSISAPPLNFPLDAPFKVLMMVGLQGSGKTTTSVKIAHWLSQQGLKVAVASVDVYRPQAIEQLAIYAGKNDVSCYASDEMDALKRGQELISTAKQDKCQLLILDTAGRTTVDAAKMQEVKALQQLEDAQSLLVIDAMMGQDAVTTAQAFKETVPLSGVVLTKCDSDAQGGAALSLVTQAALPIRFIADGETCDRLQKFDAGRITNRILGEGDIMALAQKVKQQFSKHDAKRMEKRMNRGEMDLGDLYEQYTKLLDMGGMQGITQHLPQAMSARAKDVEQGFDEKTLRETLVIIDSMTAHERAFPAVLNPRRMQRVSRGSGKSVAAVKQVILQFNRMKKKMLKMKKLRSKMKQNPSLMEGMPDMGDWLL